MMSSIVIKEESIDSRAEVKKFDHGKLKHVETQEKNPLPTPQTLKEELRPDTLPDVSGVKDFEKSKLKHVDPAEKNALPTKEGELAWISFNYLRSNNLFLIFFAKAGNVILSCLKWP